MRIETLSLKNFRNVVDQTYVLNPRFTVFIGINGRGKSTWLHALRVVCGCYLLNTPNTKKRHIIPDEIRKSNETTFFVSNYPVIVEATGYFPEYGETPITWRRRVIEGKTGTSSTKEDVGTVKDLGMNKYQTMKDGNDDLSLPVIAFFETSRVHGAGRNRSTRLGRQIFKEGYHSWFEMRASIFGYESWLASYSILVKQGKEYEETEQAFWTAIRTANPYIQTIKFEHNEIWLQVVLDDYTSEYLPLHLHSDGIISFTEMTAEIAYRCIVLNGNKRECAVTDTLGVVMIDELDLHLHPNWQRHVVSDLKNAFPNIQFVATTHSPFIVQSLEADELINLDSHISMEEAGLNPVNLTLNQVTTEIMQVEKLNSDNFEVRFNDAKEVFQTMQSNGQGLNIDHYSSLKNLIDGLVTTDTEDPVYKAFITVKKQTT
jgi:predicted ATP-binding protein involved in virulence